MNRLAYAFLGLVAGGLLGLALSWLYGLSLASQVRGPILHPDLKAWVGWSAAACALTGFVFKDKVGSALGFVFDSLLRTESGRGASEHLSAWQFVLALCVMGGAAWYVLK